MTRSRVELRLPPDEKQALRASAFSYDLSMSSYIRALAAEDRMAQERALLKQRMRPDKPVHCPD